jgi:hypothetical protein
MFMGSDEALVVRLRDKILRAKYRCPFCLYEEGCHACNGTGEVSGWELVSNHGGSFERLLKKWPIGSYSIGSYSKGWSDWCEETYGIERDDLLNVEIDAQIKRLRR